jgi:hypothetical protein
MRAIAPGLSPPRVGATFARDEPQLIGSKRAAVSVAFVMVPWLIIALVVISLLRWAFW